MATCWPELWRLPAKIAGKPARKTRERNEKLGSAEQNAAIFAAARDAARKKARGLMAPLAAIDAVEAATKLPFDQGVEAERKLFTECLFSDQSKAMIHVFFGEREVAKIPDVPKETPHDSGEHGGGDRRRHHGRRHCHELRQCRHPGAAERDRPGGAGSRHDHHPQKLRQLREARAASRSSRWTSA